MNEVYTKLNGKMDEVISLITKLESRVAKLETEQQEQEKSLNFLHSQLDDTKVDIKKMQRELAQLATSQDKSQAKESVTRLEQEKSFQNLLVTGIPQTQKEDLTSVLTSMAEKLNLSLNPSDMATVYRTKKSNIFVRCNSQSIGDKFYNSRKHLRKDSISTQTLGFPDDEPIYINEILDDQQRQLFYEARQARRSKNYRFIWTFHGHIYMKKSAEADINKICVKSDLENLD